jgi:NAD-reducing hydrogenase large subunit
MSPRTRKSRTGSEMATTISINPVTRVEGHGRITLHLDETGRVSDARLHVTQVRGFEKFCEGRPFAEMPSLMARVCGICPVSHLLASAKACDEIMAVRIPPAGARLRRILHFAQTVQSHALSFFHLSSPDLLLGMDADPVERNIFGVLARQPELAAGGIALRKFGQQVIEWLAGDRVHPHGIVPGGVAAPLTAEHRDRILARIPASMEFVQRSLDLCDSIRGRFTDEVASFANFPSLYLGTVGPRGELELYDGTLRFVDENGDIIADAIEAPQYGDWIGEAVEPWSYLKFPYFKPRGYPDGLYRVGPLARLNVAERCGTPRADEAFEAFRAVDGGRVAQSSFHFHQARLIEALHSLEMMDLLLRRDDALDPRVRATAGVNSLEGVGIAEAPRGTLIHHYRVDSAGIITWANMIIATGHNHLAINRGILQVARQFVRGDSIQQGALNRVEAVVRAFDPCLSCSTHAVGKMPLRLQLVAADGVVLDEVVQG